MMPTWTAYGQTDRGRSRPTNQDAFLVDNRSRLWAVADGMGGHPGGDVASLLVIETLGQLAPTLHGAGAMERDIATAVTTMVQQAHQAILAYVAAHPEYTGMGTTLVAAHDSGGSPPHMLIANVGDSRAYLIRDQTISQLTRDHTLVEDYVRRGYLTVAQASMHPERHVLTRAMGLGAIVTVDLFSPSLLAEDVILLCSDGLTKMLTDAEILQIVLAHRNAPEHLPQQLIQAALANGGIDNVTVVVCAPGDGREGK